MKSRHAVPPILALDLGTSSVRCALFDAAAKRIPKCSASQVYRVHHSAEHGAELDPAVLLRATRKCLRLTKSRASVIAGSGFWHSLLGLDREAKPLTPIYTWADTRGVEDAARLREQLDERVVQERTGCMLRASFWPAKLLWLRRTNPKIFRRVARWVSPAEWIFEEIFGVRACSHSMASGTGLYNFTAKDWDREMLEISGLTTSQLNPLRDRWEEDGRIIFPAIGDGAAGNLGSGASAPGVVAINVGTSAAVRTISARDTPLPLGLFRYVVDEKRALLGGAISNAGNLHAWCLRELRLSADDHAIERLLHAAARKPSHLTILPFWVSERAPTWPCNTDGVIVGLSQATTAADLLLATTTAYCHRLAEVFDLLEQAVGRARKIIVSGGILRSPASLHLLANSLGRDLITCADQEASLRGAAVHALEELGRKVPPPKFTRTIRPEKKRIAQALRERHGQTRLEQFFASLTS